MNVTEKLLSMQDTEYKAFHSRLMPTVDENKIIGIRIPVLRKFAKELSLDEARAFMQSLPHACYEENNLHAFLIERIGDYGECMKAVNAFLPFIENNTLDKWTHNKTIQKAVESYRITDEQKQYLKTLKRN